jgi:tricorn protease
VQFPSISADGKHLIYENEFELWTLDIPNGQPRKVTIDLAFDPKTNSEQFLTTTNQADGFTPSPNGDYLAVDWHGEIYVVPTDADAGEKVQVTRSPWRDRFQQYSPDGKWLAYIADESGEEEVWAYELATGNRKKLSTHGSFKQGFSWSPNSQRMVFPAANRLFEVDVATAKQTELAHNADGGFTGINYSPDGKFLVYSRGDADLNTDLYTFEIATKAEQNVTRNPFRDSAAPSRRTAAGWCSPPIAMRASITCSLCRCAGSQKTRTIQPRGSRRVARVATARRWLRSQPWSKWRASANAQCRSRAVSRP